MPLNSRPKGKCSVLANQMQMGYNLKSGRVILSSEIQKSNRVGDSAKGSDQFSTLEVQLTKLFHKLTLSITNTTLMCTSSNVISRVFPLYYKFIFIVK